MNLLDHPFFSIDRSDGAREAWSLTEVIARLVADIDPIRSYPGLAAEQSAHWHRFLVRCAAKALYTLQARPEDLVGGDVGILVSELRNVLIDEAGSVEAWHVWHDDPAAPAFLQSPVTGGSAPSEAGYKPKPIADLTALIGSKEFERKSEAVRYMTPLEATYSLIEFQGGVIFGGRGNYETQLTPSRSGKGSGVPFMGIRFPNASGVTFRHDVTALLDTWPRTRDANGLRGDIWALWTLPWDGKTSLPASQLDPAFIPMARLIRLGRPSANDGRFETLHFKASSASRIADHTEGAMLGDPFTPAVPHPKRDGQLKVRGVLDTGFTYPEAAELLGLGQKGVPSPSVQSFFDRAGTASVAGVEVLFEGVAFEQGKTLGFFRRVLPLPVDARTKVLFSQPDPLRLVHREMLEQVRRVRTVLRAASRIVLHGEPRPKGRDEEIADLAATWLHQFVDDSDRYFRFLFQAAPRQVDGDESWATEWTELLRGWARIAIEHALPALPAPSAQRLGREMNALDYLDWKLRDMGADESDSADPPSGPSLPTMSTAEGALE
ncbi:MAG: type I-E CRISPR-associated protein Cse1/CasA [Longimicrobiales bacterium]